MRQGLLLMLVIVSDLHLTDQTTGSPLNPGAFQIFTDRLTDLAFRASWRADESYRPVEQIDLLLLGDVLDTLRTTHWLQSDVRPWRSATQPQLAGMVGAIVDNILHHNQKACATLRSLAADGLLRVPQGTQSGKPVYSEQGQPVPVRTFYMAGNHDWLLHLPGAPFDAIRNRVSQHLGLANLPDVPFPHDPYESDELLATLRRHRVLARHGDIYDPLNFSEDRDASSLGDAIVIELLMRFVVEVRQHLGDEVPASVLHGLEDLDHIRPLLLAPVWMEGLLIRAGVRQPIRKEIKRRWDALVDEFLALPVVREQDTWSPFEIVDGMERALKFSKRLSIGWASKITSWLHGMRGATVESYYEHALAEQDFRNRRARHIVYGHTHESESVPLDASYADGFVLNQMYFNAGTWRRRLRQTQSAASECEFIPTENLSLLAFFCGDERGGCPFETWSGTLATAGEVATHRVDPRQAPAGRHAPPVNNPPLAAPHFRQNITTAAPFAPPDRQ